MAKRTILLVGKSGRLDCMAEALYESEGDKDIFILSEVFNRSLREKGEVIVGRSDDIEFVTKTALALEPQLAIIGPEEPLAAGVVDRLESIGVRCVGPTQQLAQIETSKAFTRKLVDTYLPHLNLNPRYRIFCSTAGLQSFMEELGDFVVKPDGLTGGKGVRVLGEHFTDISEAREYCDELLFGGGTVVIEEKLEGEEFSYQSFTDGVTTVGTIPVQDHKRANEGDQGPNTGGMGSYSCSDHLLPFLDKGAIEKAKLANQEVISALRLYFGQLYRGILYGGYIQTRNGLKLIECNARLGDPEAMNVLPIMGCDFLAVCDAIVTGTLNKLNIKFDAKSTVCKYVVPKDYPNAEQVKSPIYVPRPNVAKDKLRVYFGDVTTDEGTDYIRQSRSVAFVGIADTLDEAERIAEQAASSVDGLVRHRRDIGTSAAIQKRIGNMEVVRSRKVASAA